MVCARPMLQQFPDILVNEGIASFISLQTWLWKAEVWWADEILDSIFIWIASEAMHRISTVDEDPPTMLVVPEFRNKVNAVVWQMYKEDIYRAIPCKMIDVIRSLFKVRKQRLLVIRSSSIQRQSSTHQVRSCWYSGHGYLSRRNRSFRSTVLCSVDRCNLSVRLITLVQAWSIIGRLAELRVGLWFEKEADRTRVEKILGYSRWPGAVVISN